MSGVSKTIAVGSKNPVKIQSAINGFEAMFPTIKFSVQSFDVPSGVSDQPMSDEETRRGATNRAKSLKSVAPAADYFVGIEGGIEVIDNTFFANAWIVILDSNEKVAQGRSGSFALPPKEISKVFPIANNFIILQCQQKFPATTLSREETDFHHERLISELTDAKLLESARMMFTHMQKTAQIVNVMNDPKLSQQMPGVAATVNGVKILNRDVGEDCIARFGSMMLETEINRAI